MTRVFVPLPSMDTTISTHPDQTFELGKQWALELDHAWTLGFSGDLGVGKTRLIQGICHGWGVTGRVVSPTYSLIHEYQANGKVVHHLDLYRLDGPEAIWQAGLADYLTGSAKGRVVVEWIDRWLGPFGDSLPTQAPMASPFRWVHLSGCQGEERTISYVDFRH